MALEGGYVVAKEDIPMLAWPVRKGQYGVVVRVLENMGEPIYMVRWYYDKPAEMMDTDEVYAI